MSEIKGTNGGTFHEGKVQIRVIREVPDGLGLSMESLEQFLENITNEFKRVALAACGKGIVPRAVWLDGTFTIEGPVDTEAWKKAKKLGLVWSAPKKGGGDAGIQGDD